MAQRNFLDACLVSNEREGKGVWIVVGETVRSVWSSRNIIRACCIEESGFPVLKMAQGTTSSPRHRFFRN